MRKTLLVCLLLAQGIMAASISAGKADSSGSRTYSMENRFIRVEFSTLGGRMTRLLDKRTGRELTQASSSPKSGSFKDQFPPMKYDFTAVQYQARIVSDRADKVVLELQSPGMQGEFQFLKITRTLTLREGQALLSCDLAISNQKESMAPTVVNYWQHNFFGVAGEDNNFLLPLSSGVHCAVPTAQSNSHGSSFFTAPVRGWLAMIGVSGNGVVILPEYKRFELAFSWFCKGSSPLDTLEWRMIPEEVQDGSSLRSSFQLGLVSELPRIHGAGQAGCGTLEFTENGAAARVSLQGFRSEKVQIKVLLNDQEIASAATTLEPGKGSEVSIAMPTLPKQSAPLLAQVWNNKEMLFDLLVKTPGEKAEAVSFPPLMERQKPVGDDEEWQFDPSDEFVTPHYPWQKGGEKSRVLFLVPTAGTRDIIEMQQRFNIEAITPTVFPRSYTMSWRVKTNMPIGVTETGVNRLPMLLDEEEFSVLLIGSRPNYRAPIKWTDYPPLVRGKILAMVEEGKALILINPCEEDAKLKELLAGLKPLGKELAASMDLSAAPHFPRSKIFYGQYGKGRVVTVNYPCSAFIAPHSGYRNRDWVLLKSEHRFQEYQFAVIGKLLNWCLGKEALISSAKLTEDKLSLNVQKAGQAKVDFFGRYSQELQSLTVDLQKGENSINCPLLPHGKVYVHIRMDDDFAFASCESKQPVHIAKLEMATTFEFGQSVKGQATLSEEAVGVSIEQEIRDNAGRLLYRGQGGEISWQPANATLNRHVLTLKVRQNGQLLDERQQEFFLPWVLDSTRNYANLLWTDGDCFPEYSYPYRHEQKRQFGFNYLYAAGKNESDGLTLKFANCESGSNWHCNSSGFHNSNFLNSFKEWSDTHDSKYLVDPICKNDPKVQVKMRETDVADRIHFFGSRKLFQLGDEMSITYYNSPVDTCFCDLCLPDFRLWLQGHHASLDSLNQVWKTTFKSWDELRPMPYGEAFLHASPAPWVEHRLYMDHLFAKTLQTKREALLEKYPGAIIGPTGVNHPPNVYGGNWNFWNMRVFDCASIYGVGRIPLSFNRDQRLIMQYRGYSSPENSTRYSFWEGLFCGERSSNNWYGPTFILPDLRNSVIRKYYSDLLWELRSGPGDLLFHSRKITGQVAILHSQVSLIANFLKQKKVDYYGKQLSFARALEDLGLAYRFVAPQEVTAGVLSGFQALILPEASALGDAEAGAIRKFVRNGGVLIADYEPGTQDQYCNARQTPALDDLFAVSTRRFSLGKVSQHSISGVSINQAGRGVKAVSGEALHSAKVGEQDLPLVICNQFGKGRTVYLNFAPEYDKLRDGGKERAFPELLLQLLQLTPLSTVTGCQSPVQQSAFVNGDTYYFGLLPQPVNPKWESASLAEQRKHSVSAELGLCRSGYLYDAREGRYLGHGNKAKVTLTPGDGTLLALLPYQVTGIGLTLPDHAKQGEIINIAAEVQGSATPRHHVILLTVQRPDGSNSLEYRQIESVEDGRVNFKLPFALNDQKGEWKIRIRDAATGTTAEKTVILQ